jgi:hypothetical protein
MDEPAALRLALHIESPGSAAESLQGKIAQIDGVGEVETRVLGPARGIDAQSVAEILVIIAATTRTGVTVTAHLEEIIRNVKKIAAELGLTGVNVEVKRRKKDINLLDPDDIRQLAEQAATQSPVGRPADSDG